MKKPPLDPLVSIEHRLTRLEVGVAVILLLVAPGPVVAGLRALFP